MERSPQNSSAYAVLLAGGAGTRLWPVSRALYPKQLAKFIGNDSLVQTTLKRLRPVLDMRRVRIVCGSEHYHEIQRHITEIGISAKGKLICEPCGRNTAPAILLAVLTILEEEDDANICVFPADHVIREVEDFHKKIAAALDLAEKGRIVTFGIKPNYPETGYGYIEGAEAVSEGALIIKRFVEKPDRQTAEAYVRAGNFFWNSGMFAFKASVILKEFQSLAPEILRMMRQILKKGIVTLADYQALPDISIDYAIMEKTGLGVVLPSDFGWSDIGSWKSLYDFLEKDDKANVIEGDVIARDTEKCFILGHERLVATNCIRNMVVVETPDSVFVSDLDESRDVKEIVATLKKQGRREFKTHRTVFHPWGNTTLLQESAEGKVQRVVVYPDGAFVNQIAGDMVRHFTVLKGKALVCLGDRQRTMKKADCFSIHKQEGGRIENHQETDLVLIQVETGK
ncbi:MAG: mannose-1-phosphate guanylyltransferase/mannose-6-phosphate isomerase [Deltaproteobacteria bacterium]|nr:mannose-1-phosphate guanylyltransferase/mannose-6-phosphate isomerase [Deltaproteobacteria bacterium]MBW1961052.1 mannose-1-phosphate guanylyltransferase/mannose-6-phosphate isomerase [Deltaproteobacteria bacterium]MBW1993922.1 mannose-1-phosphate guanylyltransferase/mannose-6-phosphate isomerase [Deltaproteobacteria bacterium]MBW2150068.1 mannose-1-phosphate guanylyltransferase/mannose-6-phosphate isomerase [Deltaproteobacteria bacterium]